MGYSTNFTGKIDISPTVETSLAIRLNDYFSIRHMKRDVNALHKLFPSVESRKPISLMGDGNFGPEGEFFLPALVRDIPCYAPVFPLEGVSGYEAECPSGCPGYYCDLVLVQAQDGATSFLEWNRNEKTYKLDKWLELIVGLLAREGYEANGTLYAKPEDDDSYKISVKKNVVKKI